MKRVYWLVVAAVPLLLWMMSKGGAPNERKESAPAPAPPEPAQEAAKPVETAPPESAPAAQEPEATPEADREAASTQGESSSEPVAAAPQPEPAPAPVAVSPAAEGSPDPAREGQEIYLLDSKDQSFQATLLEIDAKSARVECSQTLESEERVRLVLPLGDQSLTVNAQLQEVEGTTLKFKVMTMKAGQKKRFEEYLAGR